MGGGFKETEMDQRAIIKGELMNQITIAQTIYLFCTGANGKQHPPKEAVALLEYLIKP
jgi:hypothetical protein